MSSRDYGQVWVTAPSLFTQNPFIDAAAIQARFGGCM